MSERIVSIIPAPLGLMCVYASDESAIDTELLLEPAVCLALVEAGARQRVAVVESGGTDGFHLAEDTDNFLGTVWKGDELEHYRTLAVAHWAKRRGKPKRGG